MGPRSNRGAAGAEKGVAMTEVVMSGPDSARLIPRERENLADHGGGVRPSAGLRRETCRRREAEAKACHESRHSGHGVVVGTPRIAVVVLGR